jgi:peroxiredoxin
MRQFTTLPPIPSSGVSLRPVIGCVIALAVLLAVAAAPAAADEAFDYGEVNAALGKAKSALDADPDAAAESTTTALQALADACRIYLAANTDNGPHAHVRRVAAIGAQTNARLGNWDTSLAQAGAGLAAEGNAHRTALLLAQVRAFVRLDRADDAAAVVQREAADDARLGSRLRREVAGERIEFLCAAARWAEARRVALALKPTDPALVPTLLVRILRLQVRDRLAEGDIDGAEALVDAAVGLQTRELRVEIEEAKKTAAGEPAQPFNIDDLDGKPVTLRSFRGKPVLLVFWATWSKESTTLLTERIRLIHRTWSGRGLQVIGISPDDSRRQFAFAKANNCEWLMLVDADRAVARKYGVRSLPFVMLVGSDGRIVAGGGKAEIDEVTQAVEREVKAAGTDDE